MQETPQPISGPGAPPSCPAQFSQISQALCSLLAEAVPNLQQLSIEGCCRDAAFPAFGSLCPQLARLKVEALTVPISALHSVGLSLPNLTCFTLTPPCVEDDYDAAGRYVDAALKALHSSKSLTTMMLDLHSKTRVSQGQWVVVPPRLVHFSIHSSINLLCNAPKVLSQLHTLSLSTIKGSVNFMLIIHALTCAPQLKQLSANGAAELLVTCDSEQVMLQVNYLRRRMLSGLDFVVPSLRLFGSSVKIHQVLASLPIIPSVESCTLIFNQTPCLVLEHCSRGFPNLAQLILRSTSPFTSNTHMGSELLASLAGCVKLQRLEIWVPLNLTTSKLARICVNMPNLKTLGYVKTFTVSRTKLKRALMTHGRELDIQEFKNIDP